MGNPDPASVPEGQVASDEAVPGDPFPKHKAGLRPYRLPYYVLGLVVLIAVFPALRHYASSLVGTKAGQIEVEGRDRDSGSSLVLSSAPPSPLAAVKAKPDQASAIVQTPLPEPPEPPSHSEVEPEPQGRSVPEAPAFVVGDRLKLSFYEQIESEEDKWGTGRGRDQRRGGSLQMRIEFSGEYMIQQNGSILVPMLGSFDAAHQTSLQLQTAMSKAFEATVGRPGTVSIAIVERPPVYIVGPLKAPGAFKHVPGMTVLHVLALAGGLSRDEQLNWQLVDSAREADKHEASIERAKRLLARHAVFLAERDGKSPEIPAKLAELSSESEARQLIASESNVRKLAVTGFHSRQKLLRSTMELAASDMESMKRRLEPLDTSLEMRSERVKNFDRLNDKGLSNSSQRMQAQSELLELESRRQDVVSAMAQAQQRLNIAQQELESSTLAQLSELEREIATIESELPLALRAVKASESILGVMRGRSLGPQTSESSLVYQILRQMPKGAGFIKASLTTPVELGDVIHVKTMAAAGR